MSPSRKKGLKQGAAFAVLAAVTSIPAVWWVEGGRVEPPPLIFILVSLSSCCIALWSFGHALGPREWHGEPSARRRRPRPSKSLDDTYEVAYSKPEPIIAALLGLVLAGAAVLVMEEGAGVFLLATTLALGLLGFAAHAAVFRVRFRLHDIEVRRLVGRSGVYFYDQVKDWEYTFGDLRLRLDDGSVLEVPMNLTKTDVLYARMRRSQQARRRARRRAAKASARESKRG